MDQIHSSSSTRGLRRAGGASAAADLGAEDDALPVFAGAAAEATGAACLLFEEPFEAARAATAATGLVDEDAAFDPFAVVAAAGAGAVADAVAFFFGTGAGGGGSSSPSPSLSLSNTSSLPLPPLGLASSAESLSSSELESMASRPALSFGFDLAGGAAPS